MECYVFTAEPSGSAYAQLIDFCCSLSSTMLLVVRDPQLGPGESIKSRLTMLNPFLSECARAKEWPGTVLYADEATVYRYGISEGLQNLLKQQEARLFGWIHPDAPEDPCFLRKSGDVLLVTVSHERDAYLLLTPEEFEILRHQFPPLASMLQKEG
jgi:hypothetical protein